MTKQFRAIAWCTATVELVTTTAAALPAKSNCCLRRRIVVSMEVKIQSSWKAAQADEFSKECFSALTTFVKDKYKKGAVYPAPKNIFRAFDLTPFDKVKVVIVGQDPYHGPGQANGLCFAVGEGLALPPSLQNIYKE